LAGDHTQALFDELREHFTEPEIIDLGFHITSFIGLTGSFERSG